MNRLLNKRALITGAASGIGRATAELYAAEGAKVIAIDLDPRVAELETSATAAGSIRTQVGDASDDATMTALVAEATRTLGGVDICFLNAGQVGRRAGLWDLEVDDWTQLLKVNLLSVFIGIRRASVPMIEQGNGSIICTSSVAGLSAGTAPAHYGASKAAVLNLALTAASQMHGTNVRVNAICPGIVETGINTNIFDDARARGIPVAQARLNPLLRHGLPHEVAQAAIFLGSDEASFVNGQIIAVDGGWSAALPGAPADYTLYQARQAINGGN